MHKGETTSSQLFLFRQIEYRKVDFKN